jgi:hypothetical protein
MSAEDVAREIAAGMGIQPSAPMTEAEAAEFRERFAAAMAEREAHPLQVLPPESLPPDELRQLLRECATVVKPGETLIIRTHDKWTPAQMRDLEDMIDSRELPFRVILVPGAELGVAEAPGA